MTEKAITALLSQITGGDPLTEQQVRYTVMTVSYTHLDVYKRQL